MTANGCTLLLMDALPNPIDPEGISGGVRILELDEFRAGYKFRIKPPLLSSEGQVRLRYLPPDSQTTASEVVARFITTGEKPSAYYPLVKLLLIPETTWLAIFNCTMDSDGWLLADEPALLRKGYLISDEDSQSIDRIPPPREGITQEMSSSSEENISRQI